MGLLQPEVLRNNLKWASEMVNDRVARGEISDEEGKAHLSKYAGELLDKIDLTKVPENQAWQYAEVLVTAERWERAIPVLESAVAHAKKVNNEDRLVNDSLDLAQALAKAKKYEEAIETSRSVFDVRPQDKAPILMAVLYEIVPALRGHGFDVEAAKLLEDAISQHQAAEVNPQTDAGAAFLSAKWHHIGKAWALVYEIYETAGEPELADQARDRAAKMMGTQGRV